MNLASIKSQTLVVLLVLCACPAWAKKTANSQQLRADYIARLQQAAPVELTRTPGSIWSADAPLLNPGSDYKARSLNDTITILVAVQTTSKSNGSVTSQRSLQTQSGISGVAGSISTHGVNPLLAAQSSTQLKGQGQTAADSTLQTSLTGQVIAVLPNGNVVIEAQRSISMNNQREMMIVRGVARPNDISANNVISSSSLSNLEIELKGKGIISDSTRPPNPLTRAVMWLFGL